MFAKDSRYRPLPDVVTIDGKGRLLPAKSLRLSPPVAGTFLHTVEESDRLDQVAFKYYQESRKWWRICDANKQVLSPQALFDKEPFVTARFPLTFDLGVTPPWAVLLRALQGRVGIEDVQVDEQIELEEQLQPVGNQQVIVQVERFQRGLLVTFNQAVITAVEVSDAIKALLADVLDEEAFQVMTSQRIGQVGKKIVIPPAVIG